MRCGRPERLETAKIGCGQWTGSEPARCEAVGHGRVDRFHVTDALVEEVQGFAQEGELKPVPDKSRGVSADEERLLSHLLHEVDKRGHGWCTRRRACDDLDNACEVSRIQEVEACEAVWSGENARERGDRDT